MPKFRVALHVYHPIAGISMGMVHYAVRADDLLQAEAKALEEMRRGATFGVVPRQTREVPDA